MQFFSDQCRISIGIAASRIIYRATVVAVKIRTKGSKNVHTLPNNPTVCYIAMDSICFAYSSTKKYQLSFFLFYMDFPIIFSFG